MPIHVLVLSAKVGESHSAMARALAGELRRSDGVSVEVLDDLTVLGPALGRFLTSGFELHLGRLEWSYDLAYRVFARTRLGREAGGLALYALGGGPLAKAITERQADVVVSTYPVMNPVLSRLRRAGRLRCPVAAVVEPLGGLAYWVQPHLDLHLLSYAGSLPEMRRLGGAVAARAVRPLVREEFLAPLDLPAARAQLGLPLDRRLIVVSGGGWGAGDIAGAAETCLSIPGADVVAIAGRNETLRAALGARLGRRVHLRVLGFTDQMHTLLSAADLLVTTTAGLSCIEARLCGCPALCYGFAIGHVRDNARAMQRHGFARRADTTGELRREALAALAGGRISPDGLAGLPSAGAAIVALAGAQAP